MRVQSSATPNTIFLEEYRPLPGHVELRLRENVTEHKSIDEETGKERIRYEYDEYTFLLKDKPGLREDIEAHLSDWLITGRTLEVNENASLVREMKEALEILGVNTNEN